MSEQRDFRGNLAYKDLGRDVAPVLAATSPQQPVLITKHRSGYAEEVVLPSNLSYKDQGRDLDPVIQGAQDDDERRGNSRPQQQFTHLPS